MPSPFPRLLVPAPVEWRKAGCDDRCIRVCALVMGETQVTTLELHSPDAHEDYVREAMGGARPTRYRGTYEYGPLTLNSVTGEVFVKDMPILDLTAKEYTLLRYLVVNPNRIVYFGEILGAVWGPGYATPGESPRDAESNLVRTTMSRLRKKLWEAAELIVNVKGRGYRMNTFVPTTFYLDEEGRARPIPEANSA